MGFEPTDCEDCFEYESCLNGKNTYCIIFEETIEPFKLITETCKAFHEECEKCPINRDCMKTTTKMANPIYWDRNEKEVSK